MIKQVKLQKGRTLMNTQYQYQSAMKSISSRYKTQCIPKIKESQQTELHLAC